MTRTIFLIGLFALSAAHAAEEPIKLDSEARYFVVEKGGTAAKPTLVLKRVGSSGTSYTKRAFDCEARTAVLVASGKTLETMDKPKPEAEMRPLTKDSVTEQLWRHVCRRM